MFDYYKNPRILSAIEKNVCRIKNYHDREDCRQEIFTELYSFMPFDENESIRLVNKVARKFQRADIKSNTFETGLQEAGIQ
jgi:hypothetical protein